MSYDQLQKAHLQARRLCKGPVARASVTQQEWSGCDNGYQSCPSTTHGTQGLPAVGQAVAQLGMQCTESLSIESSRRVHWGLLTGEQQVQQSLPLPKRLQRVPQQERQQRKLHGTAINHPTAQQRSSAAVVTGPSAAHTQRTFSREASSAACADMRRLPAAAKAA